MLFILYFFTILISAIALYLCKIFSACIAKWLNDDDIYKEMGIKESLWVIFVPFMNLFWLVIILLTLMLIIGNGIYCLIYKLL